MILHCAVASRPEYRELFEELELELMTEMTWQCKNAIEDLMTALGTLQLLTTNNRDATPSTALACYYSPAHFICAVKYSVSTSRFF